MGQCSDASVAWGFIIPNNKLCDVLEAMRKDEIEGTEDNKDQHENLKAKEKEREKQPPLERDWYKVKVEKVDVGKSSQPGQLEASALDHEGQSDLKTESVTREWRQLTQSGLQELGSFEDILYTNTDGSFVMHVEPYDDEHYNVNEARAVIVWNGKYWAAVEISGYDNYGTQIHDFDGLPTQDAMNQAMDRPANAKQLKRLREMLHVDELGIELKGRFLLVLQIE